MLEWLEDLSSQVVVVIWIDFVITDCCFDEISGDEEEKEDEEEERKL